MAIHAHSTPTPAAQRGLLRALGRSLTLPKSGDTSAADPSLRSGDTPAPTGLVPPHDTHAAVEALLAAPLPSLTSALSRRRAIFGAVALAAAPVAIAPAHAASTLSPNVRRLVELADAYEALDRRCNEHTAAYRGNYPDEAEDGFSALTAGFGPIEAEIATTPADTMVGVLAKARACQVPTMRHCAEEDVLLSAADDLHRLFGGRHV